MKRLVTISRTLLAAASLSLFAATAFAGGPLGLNLSWNECGSFGTDQRNFACATNSGVNTLYCSASVGTDMNQLNGMAGVLHLQTNEALLSDWWKIGTGGNCRATTAITADFSFIANVNCMDPWTGAAAGGINYEPSFNGANRGRIRTVCAIAGSTTITGADEWYFLKVNINNSRSTGTGSCAGCADGACIVFNSLLVTQPAAVLDDRLITNPLARRHVLWQAGGAAIGGLGCPAEVPTRNQTWGQVKSLYR